MHIVTYACTHTQSQNPFLSQTQLMSHTQSQNPFLSQTQLMSHIQSSVGQGPFLLQTQLMSHILAHYFTERHMSRKKVMTQREGSQYTIEILLSSYYCQCSIPKCQLCMSAAFPATV